MNGFVFTRVGMLNGLFDVIEYMYVTAMYYLKLNTHTHTRMHTDTPYSVDAWHSFYS